MLIDTHAHIYLDAFDQDRKETILRAKKADVRFILMPNIDTGTADAMHQVEERFPDMCKSMMGLHPCSIKNDVESQLLKTKEFIDDRTYVAIGESGIDLYWDKTYFSQQKEALKIQAQWAAELNLPLVIHSRSSMDIILELLEHWSITGLHGVFHCFGGSTDQADRIIALGFMLGIGGTLTFKKSQLPQVLDQIDPKHLVLETDSPYLAPEPYRGKRNESSYLSYVAEKLALIYDSTASDISDLTTKNAMKLFKLESTQTRS
ncbi:MAG: TatD family hydrolase [Saprospiraceae bacterium]|nr:TatD family hydrolase [Saprospiraceae bacterium]